MAPSPNEFEERLMPLETKEVISGEGDDGLAAPTALPPPRSEDVKKVAAPAMKSAAKRKMSVRRIQSDQPGGEGMSYAITEVQADGTECRKSMKILDGFSASALAKVLGTSVEKLVTLPDDGDEAEVVEIPYDVDVVFEVAAKLGVGEVRMAETKMKNNKCQRFSIFQRAVPVDDGDVVLALGDSGLVTMDAVALARPQVALETGTGQTARFMEGDTEVMEREEKIIRTVEDAEGCTQQTVGERGIVVRHDKMDGVVSRAEVSTTQTDHASGVVEVSKEQKYESADQYGTIEKTADLSHRTIDPITGREIAHSKHMDEQDGLVRIDQQTDAIDSKGIRSAGQLTLVDHITGITETVRETSYDVIGDDGQLQSGCVERRAVEDHLTGVVVVETDEFYLKDGEVEERTCYEASGPQMLSDGTAATYTTKDQSYQVTGMQSGEVLASGATACTALTDEQGLTVGTANVSDMGQTATIDYSADATGQVIDYEVRPLALTGGEPMQGAPGYAMRSSENKQPPPAAPPAYSSPQPSRPPPASSPAQTTTPDQYAYQPMYASPSSQAPTAPTYTKPEYSRPADARPSAPPRDRPGGVYGARYSTSPEVELVGDLGYLAGRYMRCGVVNGCTAWVQAEDPGVHLFWENGPLGQGWTVGTGPHVSQTFRRLILPSSPRSSPPPERRWIRIGEEVPVSVLRPRAT